MDEDLSNFLTNSINNIYDEVLEYKNQKLELDKRLQNVEENILFLKMRLEQYRNI